MSKSSVFCIAKSFTQAERIVDRLQGAGFSTSEISALMPDTGGQHDVGYVKATKAPEGAATDGVERILDIQPTELHQRTPLFIGSTNDVDAARAMLGGGVRDAASLSAVGSVGA